MPCREVSLINQAEETDRKNNTKTSSFGLHLKTDAIFYRAYWELYAMGSGPIKSAESESKKAIDSLVVGSQARGRPEAGQRQVSRGGP